MSESSLALAHLASLTSFTPDDLRGLSIVAADPVALAAVMRAYEDAGKLRSSTTWEDVAVILKAFADYLPLANGIFGIVGAVKGLSS